MRNACGLTARVLATALLCAVLLFPTEAAPIASIGYLVQIRNLNFFPDMLAVPAGGISVLVVQNREEGIIQHEVWSRELFQGGTLVSIGSTGEIEHGYKAINRVILDPGEEVIIWFYAEKGRTYQFHCNLNGHAMHGTITTE
jgi:uncharacterized cupredoxin-like copper-binding protein